MTEKNISHNKFSIGDAVAYAWATTRKNLWLFIAIVAIPEIIDQVFSSLNGLFFQNDDAMSSVISPIVVIATIVISFQFDLSKWRIFLQVVDKKKVILSDLFASFNVKLLWTYFIIYVAYSIITFVGLLLFIFPGIYFALKYYFATLVFIDKGTGIEASFEESARLTEGVKKQLFILWLLQILICIAGLMAFFVGIFVALPIVYLSTWYVYRKLSSKK